VTTTVTETSEPLTTTITETAVPELEALTGCNWVMLRTLAISLEYPFNVMTETGVTDWEHIASEAHVLRDELKDVARTYPKEKPNAKAYGDILNHLVDKPLRNACEILLETQRLLLQNRKLDLRSRIRDAAQIITDARSKLASENDSMTRAPPPDELETKPYRVVASVMGRHRDRYCMGGQCNWGDRIFHLWQSTQLELEELTRSLLKAKSDLLVIDRTEIEEEPTNQWNIARALLWTVVMYIFFVFIAKLQSMGYPWGGSVHPTN
jgi:hypothetical protein